METGYITHVTIFMAIHTTNEGEISTSHLEVAETTSRLDASLTMVVNSGVSDLRLVFTLQQNIRSFLSKAIPLVQQPRWM